MSGRAVLVAVLFAAVLLPSTRCPAAEKPADLLISLCDKNTLFLQSSASAFWPELDPGEKWLVSRGPKAPGVSERAEVVGTLIDGGSYIKAVFQPAFEGGQEWTVTVWKETASDERGKVAEGKLTTRPQPALLRPALSEAERSYRINVVPLIPLASPLPDRLVLEEVTQPEGYVPRGAGLTKVSETVRKHPLSVLPLANEPVCGSLLTADLIPGKRLRHGSAELRIGEDQGLVDIFGQPVTAKGPMPVVEAPKGKEDANFYLKAFFESAKTANDSFALDLKLNPAFRTQGTWLFRPELTATVARNVPRASNSIYMAGLMSHTRTQRRPTSAVGYLGRTWSLGPGLEGDRNLDRLNAIFDVRWEPLWKGLYHSRETRRQRAIALAEEQAAGEVKVDQKFFRLPDWGWGLQGDLGMEGGTSFHRQLVQNKNKDASIRIPAYEILRARVGIEAFLEYRWLKLTAAKTSRFLFEEEIVARETVNGTLSLRGLDEVRAFTEVSLSIALDRAQHAALSVTYQDGSKPPAYDRVDKYSIGVEVKY